MPAGTHVLRMLVYAILQDVLAGAGVHLVTAAALAKEIAVVHAMRSAGTSDFGAASPTDLIQLLLGQSEPAFFCDSSKTPQVIPMLLACRR